MHVAIMDLKALVFFELRTILVFFIAIIAVIIRFCLSNTRSKLDFLFETLK